MNDIDGNEVNVGDIVKVLVIRDDIPMADDEKPHIMAMLNNDYGIEEFVNDNAQVSVSIWVKEEQGCMYTGLYLYPHEFRLIKPRADNDVVLVLPTKSEL
jgi:hypothetical protein